MVCQVFLLCFLWACLCFGLSFPVASLAQSTSVEDSKPSAASQDPHASTCLLYRSKKDGVPVYNEADPASGVRRKLRLGEVVCYVGEKQDFAIVDGRYRDTDGRLTQDAKEAPLEYISIFYLWPPRSGPGVVKHQGSASQNKGKGGEVYRPRVTAPSGSVPEDVFAPFRAFLGLTPSEPECRAGAICEKVRQKLEATEKDEKLGKDQ